MPVPEFSNGQLDAVRSPKVRLDQQRPRSVSYLGHSINRVQQYVQDDLLHLDSIRAYEGEVICEFRLQEHTTLFDFARRQGDHLARRVVEGAFEIEAMPFAKAGIAVQSRDKLPALIDALVAAIQIGELDELMARQAKRLDTSGCCQGISRRWSEIVFGRLGTRLGHQFKRKFAPEGSSGQCHQLPP